MRQSNIKTPLVFKIALGLICAMMVSFHLLGGLYARYSSMADGSDSSRVASFNITGEYTSGQLDKFELNFFDPAKQTHSVTFKVTSDSEVAVKYDIIVTMPEEMKSYDWLIITLDGNNLTAEENVFTVKNVDSFTPNDSSERAHTLVFSIRDDYMGNPGDLEDVENGTVTITVHAEQVD